MKKKHGHLSGGQRTPEYRAWNNARNRCTNPNDPQWARYGGRGITMCKEWCDSFAEFVTYIGLKPPNTSLDRIDNDKGYEPGNVRWATNTQQYFNRSNVKFQLEDYEVFRVMYATGMTYNQIAKLCGTTEMTVRNGILRLIKEFPWLPAYYPLDSFAGLATIIGLGRKRKLKKTSGQSSCQNHPKAT